MTTNGPIPEAGTPLIGYGDESWTYGAPSPQPPAPAEGGPPATLIAEALRQYVARCPDGLPNAKLFLQAADALTAQAAEIERLQESNSAGWAIAKSRAGMINEKAAALAAKEAEWKEATQENRHLVERIAALEAALRPFAEIDLPAEPFLMVYVNTLVSVRHIQVARSTLAEKGPS